MDETSHQLLVKIDKRLILTITHIFFSIYSKPFAGYQTARFILQIIPKESKEYQGYTQS